MTVVAQALQIPDIAWSAISPELVLFGVGILVLLLDTAGEDRLQASFVAFGVTVAGAGFALYATEHVALPALVALAGVAQFALTALWRDRPRVLGALLTALGFAGAIGVTAWQWAVYAGDLAVVATGEPLVGTDTLLADMVAVDGVALFTRVTVSLAGLVTVPLGYAYVQARRIHRGEYYPLLLFAATGMTLLASAADLIMVFIAIEILSLALYILCGFAKRDPVSQEAALKYFLLGAFSSALLLYGIAVVYGVTGSTNIAAAGRALASLDAAVGPVLAGLALLVVGFAFKTAVVPFHMWTPDVYQGAPTPVTGFMAAATKAAAFAAFLRVFVGGFAELAWSWSPVFWLLAALTMIVGAVLAVVQDDVKRMLAYSAVAHAGYVMIGLLAVNREGVSGTLFYLLVYTLMSLGSFGVLSVLEQRRRKALTVSELAGLARRDLVSASLLALFLLSLAGIPGTAGFTAKFAVFRAGVLAGQVPLVVIAVISSLIAAFFYVRVIVAMFMDDLPEDVPAVDTPVTSAGAGASLVLIGLLVVALGIVPGVVVDLADGAATIAG